jgi:glutamate carboxypeptidase
MITGPGVIDMKGGIALMFAVLKELKEDLGDQALNGIVVALNDDEEIGSGGTKDILRALTKGTEAALVFEPGLADSALVSAHSGLDWIKLSVKGKAAHAGLEPERGVNACVELAAKIVEIQKLNDYPRRVSVSPDLIEGGTTVNTICENASVTMDFRYPDVAARDQVRRRLQEISDKTLTRKDQKPSDFKVELTYQVSTDPMSADKTQKLVAVAREVAKSLGQTFEARPVGYLSDGNNLADLGVPLLVGLGPYGGGMHTDHEFMKVSSFAERKALAKGLLRRILGL